jgi:hypothetical protein
MTCSLSFELNPLVGSSNMNTSDAGDHVESDIQTFALSAAQALLHRITHHRAPSLDQT